MIMMLSWCLAVLLMPPPVAALFGNATVPDFWDDFSNNIASDLAPLISLFGEDVTKQFLSGSIHMLDGVLFSIAPLGILTVIVSVIRVCGGSLLKSLVGRSWEPHGQAEVELCSSTSPDVCELWSNGGICRVFGRPRILEFVISLDIKSNDLYPFKDGFNQGQPVCGIKFPKEALNKKDDRSDARFGNWEDVTPGESTWSGWYKEILEWIILDMVPKRRKQTDNATTSAGVRGDIEADPPRQDSSSPGDDELATYPNLTLNIARLSSRMVERYLRIACIAGVLLQGSSFAFTTWVTWFRPSVYDHYNGKELLPFFVLFISGSLMLQFGMWLSSLLIDFNSTERRFANPNKEGSKDNKKTVMVWLQPGGQRVGDQEFSAFAFAKPADEYINSWRSININRKVPKIFVLVAILFSFVGWICQFIGARGLHSTVALYQLGCTVLMSIIRAFIRSNGLEEKKNMLYKKNVEGCELDWFAHHITKTIKDESKFQSTIVKHVPLMSMIDAADAFASRCHNLKLETHSMPLSGGLNCEIIIRPDGGIVRLERTEEDPGGLNVFRRACQSVMTTIESSNGVISGVSLKRELKELIETSDGTKDSSEEEKLPNLSSLIIRIRSRLAYLTSESAQSRDQAWNTAIRDVATQLKLCMQTAADYVFSHTLVISAKTNKDAIFWTAVCKQNYPKEPQEDLICFSMFRENGKWSIDADYLEAVISLLYYSMEQEASRNPQMHIKHTDFMQKRFVLERHSEVDIEQFLQYWMQRLNYSRELAPATVGRSNLSIPITLKCVSNEFTDTASGDDQGGLPKHEMISMKASSSMLQLIAQDIFTIFMDRMSLLMEQVLPQPDMRFFDLVETTNLISSDVRARVNRHIESLVGILVSAGIATREEALMTIIPCLFDRGKLSGVYDLINGLIFQANRLKRKQKFREGERIIQGLLDLHLPVLNPRLVFSLCELYRSDFRQTGSQSGPLASESYRILQQRISDISPAGGTELSSVEDTVWIKDCYQKAMRDLFTTTGRGPSHTSPLDPWERKNNLDDEGFKNLKLDSLENGQTRILKAITLRDRFNIVGSSRRTRLRLLRWAIESGCLGLVEDIWAGEQKDDVDEGMKPESAFIGGSDEVFWAVASPKVHPNTIDIVEFLISGVAIDIGKPLNIPTMSTDKSQLVVVAWMDSQHETPMQDQYKRFGSALAAAAVISDTNILRLLVEKGRDDINRPLHSGKHGNALAAALYGASTEKFKYLLDSYCKTKQSKLRHSFDDNDSDYLGIEFKVGDFGNLLIAASYWGRADCVKLIWNSERTLRKARGGKMKIDKGNLWNEHSPSRSVTRSRTSSIQRNKSDPPLSSTIKGRLSILESNNLEVKVPSPEARRSFNFERGRGHGGDFPLLDSSPRGREWPSSKQIRPNTGVSNNTKGVSKGIDTNAGDAPSVRIDRPEPRLRVNDVVTYGRFRTAMEAAETPLSEEDEKRAKITFHHNKVEVAEILKKWIEEDEEEEKSQLPDPQI
ncbi:hypothetical protein PT974_12325 [Cladobotryum mycophilum]|uniref:Uncharacterized protein n=1 Tax=Cladobotryum mycophilum TaxID=491253 RepID=A0ABR0S8U3_9HYPO